MWRVLVGSRGNGGQGVQSILVLLKGAQAAHRVLEMGDATENRRDRALAFLMTKAY